MHSHEQRCPEDANWSSVISILSVRLDQASLTDVFSCYGVHPLKFISKPFREKLKTTQTFKSQCNPPARIQSIIEVTLLWAS